MTARRRELEQVHGIEAVAEILLARAGLKVPADGLFALSLAVKGRLHDLEVPSAAAYASLLRGAGGDEEMRRLLPLVTVGKTEFFRDPNQFRALRHQVLPQLLRAARKGGRNLYIWSAGCATGEEAYSLAVLAEELGAERGEIDILATDVNPEAVAKGRRGRYEERRVRSIPQVLIDRFFTRDGGSYAVNEILHRSIRWQVHNLAQAETPSPPSGAWDLILCRNVLIYFDASAMRAAVERFFGALRPGGYLFLGYSESLFKIFDAFELVEVEGAFVYRKPEGARLRPRPPAAASMEPARPPAAPPLLLSPAMRPEALSLAGAEPTTGRPAGPEVGPAVAPSPIESAPVLVDGLPGEPLGRAIALMENGRFPEALSALRELVQQQPDHLAGQLTMGNLCSVLGRSAESRQAYRAAVDAEPLSAEARLFLGIALCDAGMNDEARRELSRALFLDPNLALAHYYLGRVCEHSGRMDEARKAYRNALASCQAGYKPEFMSHYPDLPHNPEMLARAAQYALASLT